jgi:TPP-dependent pyruvate/acetoin dehydrogenase alpha subunit
MPGVEVDGNDAIAVYEAVREAADRARAGFGPTLIEAHTMRVEGHAVHDDAAYVPSELVAEWRARDPIDGLRARLIAAGVRESEIVSIAEANKRVVEDAVVAAEAAPVPDPTGMEDEVLAPHGAADQPPLPPAMLAGGRQ